LVTADGLLLFRIFLAGFEGLIEPLVGHSRQFLLIVLAVGEARFLTIQKILVSHRIFVVGIKRERLIEVGETFIDIFGLFLRRGRIVLIEHDDPIQASDGVVRSSIACIQLRILHVILVSFFEIIRVLVNACETGDCTDIALIVSENVLECLYGQFGIFVVVFTAAVGHELLCIRRCEIELGRSEIGVEFDGLLEIVHRFLVVGIPESLNSLVQIVPRLQLRATGCGKGKNRQEGEHEFGTSHCSMPPYLPAWICSVMRPTLSTPAPFATSITSATSLKRRSGSALTKATRSLRVLKISCSWSPR